MLVLLPPSQTKRAGGRRHSSAYVRVVTTGADGVLRALNHINKTAKGALVRALAEQRSSIRSCRGLLRWAESTGVPLSGGYDGEVLLHA